MVLQKSKVASAAAPGQGARARVAGLDWDLVRVFLDVARTGRLSAAAERLGMNISTVSRRLESSRNRSSVCPCSSAGVRAPS